MQSKSKLVAVIAAVLAIAWSCSDRSVAVPSSASGAPAETALEQQWSITAGGADAPIAQGPGTFRVYNEGSSVEVRTVSAGGKVLDHYELDGGDSIDLHVEASQAIVIHSTGEESHGRVTRS